MTDGLQDPGLEHHDEALHSLMEIFDELSFREKWKKVFHGLKQPKETGEYKYAKLQMQRLSAPAAAILLPIIVIMLLMTISVFQPEKRTVEVQIMEPESIEELEELEEILEEIEPPEPVEMEVPDEMTLSEVTEDVPSPPTEFSPQPAALDSVALTKSPVILKGIMGSRSPGARGSALAGYGGSGATERSVLLALRWLKKNQVDDGSWNEGIGTEKSGGHDAAMTALALLTYLAHGETPASEEFGPTVERAIKYLLYCLEGDGHFKTRDSNDYTQPIVAYALSEAYAMTKVPMVKEAAEQAIVPVVRGQNAKDMLWNYKFDPSSHLQKPGERNDLSFAGWCIQALKAASMADLDVEGLDEAKKKAIIGLKKNFRKTGDSVGGFCYTTGGSVGPLTGAGVLCMQLLGGGKTGEAKGGLKWLDDVTCDWEKPFDGNPIYHWYYITQAKFHAGGATWNNWNKDFSPDLVKNQIVITKAIENLKGDLVDIGYWTAPSDKEYGKSPVQITTMCALMLQVYYRYLPTYKAPEDLEEDELTIADEDQDIDIQIL
ncbi:MAG: terpene cyclase/mutase family protein [Verrucomicrobia bacterium]|nr:terpene cyclase/mutase family protein [Verrucomicrobiota bacterium]